MEITGELGLGVLIFLPIILQVSAGWGPFRGAAWNALGKPIVDFCISINPLWSLNRAIGDPNAIGVRLDMVAIWQTLSQQLLVSVLASLLAVFAIRRVHLRETTEAARREQSPRSWRLPRWKRRLEGDPMIWKEIFAGSAVTKLGRVGQISIALILLTVCAFTVQFLVVHFSNIGEGIFHWYLMGLTGYLGTGILLILAARAAGLVTSEKERDCWSSLLATPLSGQEIVRGKMWGNLYSLRWPLLILIVNWALGVLVAPAFLWASVGLLITFLLMAWYVTNLGLCFSLSSLTTLRSMGATLGTLLITGGGYMFCCCMVVASSASNPGDFMMLFLAPCIPFLSIFPVVAYMEYVQDSGGMMEDGMGIAYGLGVVGYLVVANGLYVYMSSNFDRLAGRTDDGRPLGVAPNGL